MKVNEKVMKAPFYVIIFIVLFAAMSCSQHDDPSVKIHSYFEQTPPSDTASVFAPGIISTLHHEHSRITFSKNGTEMFWAVIPIDSNYRDTGGSPFILEAQNIWSSKFQNGKWAEPGIFQFTKISDGSTPVFSSDGNLFYYRSAIPDVDPDIRPRPSQLWKVEYSDAGWGVPVKENNLIPIVENKTFMSFCFAENRNLYFDYGGPDSVGEWWWSIYFSEYDNGVYLAPVKMGSGINDGEANWCPWIAPDESYLIFSSHREGEFGRGDLYISFKDDDDKWSEPLNMGQSVNTEMQERFPSVSPDGKYLFFARHMPETFSDIFWIDAEVIDELK